MLAALAVGFLAFLALGALSIVADIRRAYLNAGRELDRRPRD
jgi:hypothetical protein